MAKLTFWRGRKRYRIEISVEAAGKRLLVDCGLFQGTTELKERNRKPLPIDPKTIDYALLTHAHLTTPAGFLYCWTGFGPIFANPATIDLTGLEGFRPPSARRNRKRSTQ
jgi:Cft2 family RNA processing exonuclease